MSGTVDETESGGARVNSSGRVELDGQEHHVIGGLAALIMTDPEIRKIFFGAMAVVASEENVWSDKAGVVNESIN